MENSPKLTLFCLGAAVIIAIYTFIAFALRVA